MLDQTTIEIMRYVEQDSGLATLPPSPSRTHAHARTQSANPVPWCTRCNVLGHDLAGCPLEARESLGVISDEHQLERLLVGHGWLEAAR